MTVSARSRYLHRLRNIWLVAVVVAGTVAAGAGIGTAADTSTVGAKPESPATTVQLPWRIHNFTDQTLTAGDFHRDQGANRGSALAFGGTTPWAALKSGEGTAEAFQPFVVASTNEIRTWGRVCYLGQIWNMPRVISTLYDMFVFAVDDGAGGRKLMITRGGGGSRYDVDMNAYGEPC